MRTAKSQNLKKFCKISFLLLNHWRGAPHSMQLCHSTYLNMCIGMSTTISTHWTLIESFVHKCPSCRRPKLQALSIRPVFARNSFGSKTTGLTFALYTCPGGAFQVLNKYFAAASIVRPQAIISWTTALLSPLGTSAFSRFATECRFHGTYVSCLCDSCHVMLQSGCVGHRHLHV